MLEVALTDPPVTPAIAFVKTPSWDHAEQPTKETFEELVALLGKPCTEVALPDVFKEWIGAHRALMYAGMARHLEPYYRRGREKLSDPLRNLLEEGMKITAVE